MKLLLVSDYHHFSTKDVFTAYVNAFKQSGINFNTAELHSLVDQSSVCHMSTDASLHFIMAKALNVQNEFTHVLFISGLVIPDWMLATLKKCGLKVGIIACDDPHASKQILMKKKYFDYWFTNEKTLEDHSQNIFYVPTGTDNNFVHGDKSKLSKDFINDVVFVGTVYPDRIKPLEDACRYCEENGLKISIYGLLLNVSKDSIINKYTHNHIISNDDTKMLYYGSKVVINIDRNVLWNCNEKEGNSDLLGDGKPYSTNPRAYEVAYCKSIQLYINPRQEFIDIFGDNSFVSTYNNVGEQLDKIFKLSDEDRETKINNCFDIVSNNHLYLYRAAKIINILERG